MKNKKIKYSLIVFLFMINILNISKIYGYATNAESKNISNLVILASYKDSENTYIGQTENIENYKRIKMEFDDNSSMYQGADTSLKNYLKVVSFNKLNVNNIFPQISGSTFTKFTLSKNKVDYDSDYAIIEEIINAINSGSIAFNSLAKYDYNESDVMDNLTVILDGKNEGMQDEIMYPHKSVASNSTKIKNKYYVRNYNFIDTSSIIVGFQRSGVVIHEFMHTLGAGDLYSYTLDNSFVGAWDIMSSAGMFPYYPLSITRQNLGWLGMNEITSSGTYTLDKVNVANGNQAYVIKTPLSTNEYFVIEYRAKMPKTENAVSDYGIDTKIYNPGLIIYRVNNSVEAKTNRGTNPYVYVFRKGETAENAGGATNNPNLINAAIVPNGTESENLTSFGTTSMNDTWDKNTIYYSNGKNSGIKIDNVRYEGEKLKVDVTFPDYSAMNLWDAEGNIIDTSEDISDITHTVFNNKNIVAITKANKIYTKYLLNGTWTNYANTIDGINPKFFAFNNNLYIAYFEIRNNLFYPTIAKYNNGNITKISSLNISTDYMNITTDGNEIYMSISNSENKKYRLYKLSSTNILNEIGNLSITGMVTKHGLCIYNSNPVIAFSDFGSSINKKIKVKEFKNNAFSDMAEINVENANQVEMKVLNNKIYLLGKNDIISGLNIAKLAIIDAQGKTEIDVPHTSNISEISLDSLNGNMYVGVVENDIAKVYKNVNNTLEKFETDITTNVLENKIVGANNKIYSLTKSNNTSDIYMYSKELQINNTLDSNNYLKSLSISNANITFNRNTLSYTINVENNITSVNVNAEAESSKASVIINKANTLNVGKNNIQVRVVAENGTDKVYNVMVIRKDNIPEVTNLKYQSHIQDIGWQYPVTIGQISGTSGLSKRLEGIKIKFESNKYVTSDSAIEYSTHVQNIGWQAYRKNYDFAGTSGISYRLEAIKIRLKGKISEDYDVYYRVHVQEFGWLDWAKNDQIAGTTGYGYRLEAIQIKLVKKGSAAPGSTIRSCIKKEILYSTHVQDVGWQNYAFDGKVAGTTGMSRRLEGIKIMLLNQEYSGNIEYQTHIQDIGWENHYTTNNNVSGTTGRSLRLEAIRIRLTEDMSKNYDIYYRVHVQKLGWLDWAKNGQSAGTAGFSYRLEAIQIKLVKKGNGAPGSTYRTFIQR